MLDITYGSECNLFTDQSRQSFNLHQDEVAEWLRRWTANPMCSARVGSNPILVDIFINLLTEMQKEQIQTCSTLWQIGRWEYKSFQKGFPLPGIEPGPPGWEPGILTTRP